MVLRWQIKDGVARIELNRPERHNAIDRALKAALEEAVDAVAGRLDEVRCVVVGGAGKSLSSGADLAMLRGMDAAAARRFMLDAAWLFRAIERLPVPVIAEVKGYCLGGGFELLLHCDIAVAAEDAIIGFPEVPLGLVTTTGAVSRLASAIGAPRASDLLLTGRRLSGAEAHAMGLVARLTTRDDLAASVDDLAKKLATEPREALAAMKGILRRQVHAGSSSSWMDEAESFEALLPGLADKAGERA